MEGPESGPGLGLVVKPWDGETCSLGQKYFLNKPSTPLAPAPALASSPCPRVTLPTGQLVFVPHTPYSRLHTLVTSGPPGLSCAHLVNVSTCQHAPLARARAHVSPCPLGANSVRAAYFPNGNCFCSSAGTKKLWTSLVACLSAATCAGVTAEPWLPKALRT